MRPSLDSRVRKSTTPVDLVLDAVAATDGHLVAVGIVVDVVVVPRLVVEDVVER
jgi:hypothetical protein